jgi:hypothetical protein
MSATLNGARRYHSPYISLLTPSVESFGAPIDVGLLEDTSFVRWLVMPAVSRYLSAPAGAQRQSMITRKDLQSDFQDFASFDTGGTCINNSVQVAKRPISPTAPAGRSAVTSCLIDEYKTKNNY